MMWPTAARMPHSTAASSSQFAAPHATAATSRGGSAASARRCSASRCSVAVAWSAFIPGTHRASQAMSRRSPLPSLATAESSADATATRTTPATAARICRGSPKPCTGREMISATPIIT